MLRIVTVNWRNYQGQGADYANLLYDMVTRNLEDGFAGQFEVFTDDPSGLHPSIIARELPGDLTGWWNKLWLTKRGLFDDDDRIVFFDLDSLITGRLDEIVQYDGEFAILRDAYRPNGLQSSAMVWRANGAASRIWEEWDAAGRPEIQGGDQSIIEKLLPDANILQELFPDKFVSFKASGGNPPEKASVVFFHGEPRPHQVVDGWVPHVRKIGGMTRAELSSVCNTVTDQIHANVRASIEWDIPWLDTCPEHDGHVCIVGGGPSLIDTLDELKWRQSIGQDVVAVNGTAKFLQDNDVLPDFIVMSDARPENAKFLDGLDRRVGALLASQCHSDVFDKAFDRWAMLWHANTPGMPEILADEKDRPVHLIGGGSTVGLNAIVLAFARGYRKIHLYGFDSSFVNNHHAYSQPQNDADRVVDALYGDKSFKTTAWMVQQVNEFQELVPGLVSDGCVITVAGEGLLQSVARDLANNMPMTPAEQRASEVLSRLNGAKQPVGVEVGVFAGEMSAALLRSNPILHLNMVDSWEGDGGAYIGDSGDWHAGLKQDTQDDFMRRAIDRTAFAGERAKVIRKRSVEAAEAFPDHSIDFVFIDADHSKEGCAADISAWAPKVKPGGWLGGHDYENTAFPKFGVTEAVTEYAAREGLSLDLGQNFTWFLKMPSHQPEQ